MADCLVMSFVVFDQNRIPSIKPYVGESTSAECMASVKKWLGMTQGNENF